MAAIIARPKPDAVDVVACFSPRLNSVRNSLSFGESPGNAVAFSTNASQSINALNASTALDTSMFRLDVPSRTARCSATAQALASSAVIGLAAVGAGVLDAFAGGT